MWLLKNRLSNIPVHFKMSNLDEFYKVRYATLVRSISLESKIYANIIENQSNVELLDEINKRTNNV